MLNDMRSRCVSSAIAEPLARFDALYDTRLVRKPTICASILWKFHLDEAFIILFHYTLIFGSKFVLCADRFTKQ